MLAGHGQGFGWPKVDHRPSLNGMIAVFGECMCGGRTLASGRTPPRTPSTISRTKAGWVRSATGALASSHSETSIGGLPADRRSRTSAQQQAHGLMAQGHSGQA